MYNFQLFLYCAVLRRLSWLQILHLFSLLEDKSEVWANYPAIVVLWSTRIMKFFMYKLEYIFLLFYNLWLLSSYFFQCIVFHLILFCLILTQGYGFLLIWEREKHQYKRDTFIGCLLYTPWPRMEQQPFGSQDDAPTNWGTQPGLSLDFGEIV